MNIGYYKDKINDLEKEASDYKQRSIKYSFLRLTTLFMGTVIIYFAYDISNTVGIFSVFLVIVLFIFIVKKHNFINNKRSFLNNQIKIYKNEIDLFDNSNNIFGNGKRFIDNNHNYSSDLDLFGDYSLFNLLNRTVTQEGENILSSWLLNLENNKEKIIKRQEIIKEIAKKSLFKEKFLNTLFLDKDNTSADIEKWISVFRLYFSNKKILRLSLAILPVLILIALISGFVNPYFWNFAIIFLAISYIISAWHKKAVDKIHNHISNQETLFYKYSLLINYIKNEEFENNHLKELKQKIIGEGNIREQLVKLSILIKKLDFRLNFLINPILNLLFLWDIRQSYHIEQWMQKNQNKIIGWLQIIGEFDALLSLSILHFNNPDWIFPLISNEDIEINAKQIGHPLIKKSKRVNNDYAITGKAKFDIITGSNMAGKSTFLRTIGLNTVLALSGCPVCANEFNISTIKLITYMRINDSLEDNLSSFHAELRRIKHTLEFVRKNENCFLLMDEILRGTNSEDRYIGSVALLKQLINNNASGIIATHDLKLTELALEMPEKIRNYNFSVKTKGNDLYFDYKLTNGICDSFNATILMKKIGIEIS